MVMMLKQFHDLEHDVVAKASVRSYDADPRFVVLSLDYAPPPALLHRRTPNRLTVLLTRVQAGKLAAQLARSGQENHPEPGPPARARGARDHRR